MIARLALDEVPHTPHGAGALVKVERDDDTWFRLVGEPPQVLAQANAFLEAVAIRGMSGATLRAYAYDLLTIIRWLQSCGYDLDKLRPVELSAFIGSQRAKDAHPRSINRRLNTLCRWYRFIVGSSISGQGVSLPGPHYKGPGRGYLGLGRRKRRELALRVKTPHTVMEPLDRAQVSAFFSSLRRYRDLAIVHLMLLCGLRSREVLSLHTSDVDVFDRRLRVHGKGNRERIVPLPNELLLVLNDYIRIERPKSTAGNHLLVVLQGKRRGHPMTPAGLRSLFRYRRQVNSERLADANAHRFRHTFGADMARAGVRLPILQRLMGHADAKTTLQYIHLSMADIATEYDRAIKTIAHKYEQGI